MKLLLICGTLLAIIVAAFATPITMNGGGNSLASIRLAPGGGLRSGPEGGLRLAPL